MTQNSESAKKENVSFKAKAPGNKKGFLDKITDFISEKMARLYGNSIFNFLKNCHAVFHNKYTYTQPQRVKQNRKTEENVPNEEIR